MSKKTPGGNPQPSMERVMAFSSNGGDTDEYKAAAYVVICGLLDDLQDRAEILKVLGLADYKDLAVERLKDKINE